MWSLVLAACAPGLPTTRVDPPEGDCEAGDAVEERRTEIRDQEVRRAQEILAARGMRAAEPVVVPPVHDDWTTDAEGRRVRVVEVVPPTSCRAVPPVLAFDPAASTWYRVRIDPVVVSREHHVQCADCWSACGGAMNPEFGWGVVVPAGHGWGGDLHVAVETRRLTTTIVGGEQPCVQLP